MTSPTTSPSSSPLPTRAPVAAPPAMPAQAAAANSPTLQPPQAAVNTPSSCPPPIQNAEAQLVDQILRAMLEEASIPEDAGDAGDANPAQTLEVLQKLEREFITSTTQRDINKEELITVLREVEKVHKSSAPSVVKLHRYHKLSRRYLAAIGVSKEQLKTAQKCWLKAGSLRSLSSLISSAAGLASPAGTAASGAGYLGSSVVTAIVNGAAPVTTGLSRILTNLMQLMAAEGGLPTLPADIGRAPECAPLAKETYQHVKAAKEQCDAIKQSLLRASDPFLLCQERIQAALKSLAEKEKQLEQDRCDYRQRSSLISNYLIGKATQTPTQALITAAGISTTAAVPGIGPAIGAGIALGSVFLQMPFAAIDHHNQQLHTILLQTKHSDLLQTEHQDVPISDCLPGMLDDDKIRKCWKSYPEILQKLCLDILQHGIVKQARKIDHYQHKVQHLPGDTSIEYRQKQIQKLQRATLKLTQLTQEFDTVSSGEFSKLPVDSTAAKCFLDRNYFLRRAVIAYLHLPMEVATQVGRYAGQAILAPAGALVSSSALSIGAQFAESSGLSIAALATRSTGAAVGLANSANNARQKRALRDRVQVQSHASNLSGRTLHANATSGISASIPEEGQTDKKPLTKTVTTPDKREINLVSCSHRLAKKAMGKKRYRKTMLNYGLKNIASPFIEPVTRAAARASYDEAGRTKNKIARTRQRLKFVLEDGNNLPTSQKKKPSPLDARLKKMKDCRTTPTATPAATTPATALPAPTTPAATTPATALPAPTTPAATTPATALPAPTTPAATTPATALPAPTTPAATTPATAPQTQNPPMSTLDAIEGALARAKNKGN